jgi:hypothetical protein
MYTVVYLKKHMGKEFCTTNILGLHPPNSFITILYRFFWKRPHFIYKFFPFASRIIQVVTCANQLPSMAEVQEEL